MRFLKAILLWSFCIAGTIALVAAGLRDLSGAFVVATVGAYFAAQLGKDKRD